jgi:hypothetical protein
MGPQTRTRRFVTDFYELTGVSVSRLVELQAGSLQQIARANRERIAAERASEDLAGLLAAQAGFYSALTGHARHAVRARYDLVRDAAQRSADLLRELVVADPAADDTDAVGRAER